MLAIPIYVYTMDLHQIAILIKVVIQKQNRCRFVN